MTTHLAEPTRHAPLRAVVAATVAVIAILLAFVWPTYLSSVKDLPMVVAGTPAATATVSDALTSSGAFVVSTVADRAAAVAAIKERAAYGAVVLGPTAMEVLTASAASPVASQVVSGVAQRLQVQAAQAAAAAGDPAPQVTITDIVPLSADDPRGAGFAVAGLPLALGGLLGGALVWLLVTGRRARTTAVIGYAALAGLGITAVLDSWLGILSGSFVSEWAAISTALLATGAAMLGLGALLGRAGIALGAVLTLLVANPLSALTVPQEMLPWHWGEIGQWFVPGASGTLLRSASSFPDAPVGAQWLALALWAVTGLLMLWLGRPGTDASADPA